MTEKMKFLEARIEALEVELDKKTKQLKEAHDFMEKIAKEMEVEFEKL